MLTVKSNHKTLNIAHRGARSLAPENTLAAARKALEIGADMWELDVGMTADSELVVIHDATLERTSNVQTVYPQRRPWRVGDFSLDELRQLDFGGWFIEKDPFGQIAQGKVSEEELNSYRGERIVTLREALEFTLGHDWLVNVEIKQLHGAARDREVVERTVNLLAEVGMTERVVVSSFNVDYLQRARRANSGITIGWLVYTPHVNPVRTLARLKAQNYHPKIKGLHLFNIQSIQAKGFHVFVWVVNDLEAMKTFVDAGVDGIFTDFPQELKKLLSKAN